MKEQRRGAQSQKGTAFVAGTQAAADLFILFLWIQRMERTEHNER